MNPGRFFVIVVRRLSQRAVQGICNSIGSCSQPLPHLTNIFLPLSNLLSFLLLTISSLFLCSLERFSIPSIASD